MNSVQVESRKGSIRELMYTWSVTTGDGQKGYHAIQCNAFKIYSLEIKRVQTILTVQWKVITVRGCDSNFTVQNKYCVFTTSIDTPKSKD